MRLSFRRNLSGNKKGIGFEDIPAWAIWLFLIIFFSALSYYVYKLIIQQLGK